ncbi:tocopherol cyclase family protein, partial [Mycobacterium scrofulaceum]|uniref:tocopherol cyclase family protein n=1 Tax=Mycobacterium scrofulaceum TaxID=1783 RepID=UPI0022B23BFF
VALCSVNRHPDGDWATVAVALHPGDVVRSAVMDGAEAESSTFSVHAGTFPDSRLAASTDRLQIDLDGIHLNLQFTDPFNWPKAFGGGGVFSSVPFLNQYWHPYRLGGKATGTVEFRDRTWSFSDARLYTERNWGAGFPERWWWGQAHDFGDADVSVAFSGGLLQLGPIRRDVTGMQRDRDRGPVAIRVPVHTAQRDDDATRGGIGEAPEPALHFGPVRRHGVAEGHVGAGAPIGVHQWPGRVHRDPAQVGGGHLLSASPDCTSAASMKRCTGREPKNPV